jgi:hypothetical protein
MASRYAFRALAGRGQPPPAGASGHGPSPAEAGRL